MSVKNLPSVDYVRQCFRYEDGKLYWLWRPSHHFPLVRIWRNWNNRFAGLEAGGISTPSKDRTRHYWAVAINCKQYPRATIVWLLHNNKWVFWIDHKNRDSLNDKIENLRPSDGSKNIANSSLSSSNTSGYKGVSYNKTRETWRSYIRVHRQYIHLGTFRNPEEAHEAYMEAARKYFGEFATDGK